MTDTPSHPSHPYLLLHYIKDTLLPALVLNIGTDRAKCAESLTDDVS